MGTVNLQHLELITCRNYTVSFYKHICTTCISIKDIYIYTAQVVPRRAGGGSFRRKKKYIAKKEFAYRMCARRPTDHRDAQTISLLWTTCFDVSCLQVRWSNVVACEVMWGELLWLVATWHGMSCHVIWCGGHVIWCDVIACVVSCHVMECDVMVMSCCLLCPAMGWNVMSLECHWLWSRCGSKMFEVVLWRCGDPKYYSVLQSTTPVLLCTEYYSNTTLYYKVLLQYYSVQSTTPILLCTTKYNVLLHHYPVLQSTPVLLCTSANIAPATKNDSHDSWLIRVTYETSLQCAEQVKSPFKLAEECACRVKTWARNPWIASANIKTIRWHSEDSLWR